MAMQSYADLSHCRWEYGGFVITWETPNPRAWKLVLEAVRALPSADRSYLPDERAWWISSPALTRLGAHVFSNFQEAVTDAKLFADEIAPPPASVIRAYATLHINLDAPTLVIEAAYFALENAAAGNDLTLAHFRDAYQHAIAYAQACGV